MCRGCCLRVLLSTHHIWGLAFQVHELPVPCGVSVDMVAPRGVNNHQQAVTELSQCIDIGVLELLPDEEINRWVAHQCAG